MAEPALKIVTEFVRIAVADLEMRMIPEVERQLRLRGLTVVDLHNALALSEAIGSNKSDARGVFLTVKGATTEDVELTVEVWIDMDCGFYRVEKVA